MEHSELFLLLPRYEDVTEQPWYITPLSIIPYSDFIRIIEDINVVCCFLENENYLGYYDADNVAAFLYPVNKIGEYYPNIATRMRMVMHKFGENWRTHKSQRDAETYSYYFRLLQDYTLCEITERKATSTGDCSFLLLNISGAFRCSNDVIKTQRGRSRIEIDVKDVNVKSISEWYEINRRPHRVFNLNPKHGENGKGAHPHNKGDSVSLLMCSKEEAEIMLHKAYGTDSNTLFYFDKTRNQYVEFKKERENTYHAFYLEPEDNNRISSRIKEMISKLS